ncbi:CRISPR-associated helicase Cas3' [Leekyejoonella antrihumi]|uniref:CRISPR-associated helicase Cas3' n=1 Tax=Leekyejoonella antrihumi TaxID=1660198 RepID=UPI0016496B76|nr:CRISPR-associated helicase Cas3' [Leekyejoonella antrihumi]
MTLRAEVWGKAPERLADGLAPYPLVAHLLDTLLVAGVLWDTWLSPRLRRLLAKELCGGDEGCARGWVVLAAGLHDVGKATPVFQLQAASPRAGVDAWRPLMATRLTEAGLPACDELAVQALATSTGRVARRHEYLGLVALSGHDPVELRGLRLGTDWLAAVAGGHHGHWYLPARDSAAPYLAAGMCSGGWADVQADLRGVVAAAAGCDLAETPILDPARAAVVVTLLTGLTILADWVASSDLVVHGGYRVIEKGIDPYSGGWPAARGDALVTVVASTVGSYVPPGNPRATVLGRPVAGQMRSLRPLQADAQRIGPGAWFVAYPTGEGKTEAALLRHMAGDPEGLIFGLPTRATTTAMQQRLGSIFAGTGNTVLLSHQYAAAHRVECASEYGLEWYSSSIRRLIAPLVAATCDQVLVGALRQRHAALRLLALANHHVVLDEVHTYDQYQSHLLKALMAWWGATGTRVTLLSATMPQWQRRQFASAYTRDEATCPDEAAYPAHWVVTGEVGQVAQPTLSQDQPDLRVELVSSDEATDRHAAWAKDTHQAHPGCHIAVIRSTVDDAVDTARRVQSALPGVAVVCLHSRMTVAHRARVEAQLIDRLGPRAAPGPPLVVVATQVIEASLDLDFDLMSSDLTPAASLVQRAGRLWRFRDDTQRRARFGVLPDGRMMHVVVRTRDGVITGRGSLPYFASELARVAQWLSDTPTIQVPENVQAFVDQTSLDLDQVCADLVNAEEIAAASRRIESATLNVSNLRQRVAAPEKRCRYADLNALTGGPEDACSLRDEDRMGTRFDDDQVSGTYLLVGEPAGVPLPVGTLAATGDAARVRQALDAMVSVTGARLCAALDEASASTVPTGWRPRSRLLAHARPVHVDQLSEHGLTYHERLGLIAADILTGAP